MQIFTFPIRNQKCIVNYFANDFKYRFLIFLFAIESVKYSGQRINNEFIQNATFLSRLKPKLNNNDN